MSLRSVLSALALTASLAFVATPASATSTIVTGQDVKFNFTLDSGSINVGSSYGNTRTFDSKETYKDASGVQYDLGVTASAWTATQSGSSYVVSDAILGQWQGGGLGVTNRNENGGNNSHQVDNNLGSVDFILLEFDRPVTLSSLSTVAYRMTDASGNALSAIDNDVAISSVMPVYKTTTVVTEKTTTPWGSTTPKTVSNTTATNSTVDTKDLKSVVDNAGKPQVTDVKTVSSSVIHVTKRTTTETDTAPTVKASDFKEVAQSKTKIDNNTVSGSVVLDAIAVPASKTWLVGASFTNQDGKVTMPDGFKLKNLQVIWSAAVPEPSTWAMMIVGFGFVGCAARRQRRIAAAA